LGDEERLKIGVRLQEHDPCGFTNEEGAEELERDEIWERVVPRSHDSIVERPAKIKTEIGQIRVEVTKRRERIRGEI
jgi:hypothetical protein